MCIAKHLPSLFHAEKISVYSGNPRCWSGTISYNIHVIVQYLWITKKNSKQ